MKINMLSTEESVSGAIKYLNKRRKLKIPLNSNYIKQYIFFQKRPDLKILPSVN